MDCDNTKQRADTEHYCNYNTDTFRGLKDYHFLFTV